VPLRYGIYGPLVYLSGVTSEKSTLADQAKEILSRIGESLEDAGSSWEQVAKVSFYLQRDESQEEMAKVFNATVTAPHAELEYAFVDGYSAPGKRAEIEITATV